MITLRRGSERRHAPQRKQQVWLTFDPRNPADWFADGFGAIEYLNEERLPPGAEVPPYPSHDAEIITYVREGALAHEDSLGRSGVLHAGEFQRMTAGRSMRHSEMNASRADCAHVFQIWLRPGETQSQSDCEQKRFFAAERHGTLCVVASPDGRRGSLSIHQDAMIFSAMFDPGQHVIHELSPGRSAWLHVVQGEITLGDIVLSMGDGAGFTTERAISFTAREATEVLLVDLCKQGL